MINFGDDIHLSRIDHMGGGSGFINPLMACSVPSQNYVASSPESQGERYVENLAPRLEIIEQPISKFRFRYLTEMKGPHGCLTGKSKSSHTRTYPTVRLCNYYRDDAVIRCSLYTTDRSNPFPHGHALIATTANNPDKESHEKSVLAQNDYTVEFPGLGILYIPQKKFKPKLHEKLLAAFEEKFKRGPGLSLSPMELAKALEKIKTEVKHITDNLAKCMDKNQVTLLFEAFHMDSRGIMQPICDPVLSDPIRNEKSSRTNDLRICRIDKLAGPSTGGEEIFLLVEKVSKGNIEVHFADATGWVAKAEFTQSDVHHQYAIVCRTPPYRNVDITKDAKVEIKLYRPSDKAESKPHTFYYKPIFSVGKRSRSDDCNERIPTKEMYSKKQKTFSEDQFSSNDFLATSLMNLLQNDLRMEDYHDFEKTYAASSGRSISSLSDNSEFTSATTDTDECSLESLLESFQPESVLFSNYTELTPVNIAMDGSHPKERPKSTGGTTDSPHRQNSTSGSATDANIKFRIPNNDDTRIGEMAERLADVRLQDDEEAHQRCSEDTKRKADFFKCIMGAKTKLFEAAKEKVLFRLTASNSCAALQRLLDTGVRDINVRDETGATALHWAVRYRSADCLKTLMKCPGIDLNVMDLDGRTPLHIAVDQHDSKTTEALLDAGADVLIPKGKTGDTVLHTAVKWEDYAIILLLLQTEKFTLQEENYYQKSVRTMLAQSNDRDLRELFVKYGYNNDETPSDGSINASDLSEQASNSDAASEI